MSVYAFNQLETFPCIFLSFLVHDRQYYIHKLMDFFNKNPAYGRQRISQPMQIVGPILLHFVIKKLLMMDVLFEETDWLCFALLFHQEIAGDGRALQECQHII